MHSTSTQQLHAIGCMWVCAMPTHTTGGCVDDACVVCTNVCMHGHGHGHAHIESRTSAMATTLGWKSPACYQHQTPVQEKVANSTGQAVPQHSVPEHKISITPILLGPPYGFAATSGRNEDSCDKAARRWHEQGVCGARVGAVNERAGVVTCMGARRRRLAKGEPPVALGSKSVAMTSLPPPLVLSARSPPAPPP